LSILSARTVSLPLPQFTTSRSPSWACTA
jgi:hypothetical protein